MDLVTTALERVFHFENEGAKITLDDPDPGMEVAEVMRFYSQLYPLLTICQAKGPEIDEDKLVYHFLPMIGTKG